MDLPEAWLLLRKRKHDSQGLSVGISRPAPLLPTPDRLPLKLEVGPPQHGHQLGPECGALSQSIIPKPQDPMEPALQHVGLAWDAHPSFLLSF